MACRWPNTECSDASPYDLYPNGDDFLLDVQADILDGLNTRIVVPLQAPERAPEPAGRLNPSFQIEGARYVMVTQFMAAMPEHQLGDAAATLDDNHDEIVAALDMVLQDF